VQHTGVTNHLTRGWIDENGDSAEIHPELDCSDLVELEIVITARTDDGSLYETWMLSLLAASADNASLSQSLTAANGSLDIESFAPTGEFDGLQAQVDMSFSNAGVTGEIIGQAESSSGGNTVSAQSFDIASFLFL